MNTLTSRETLIASTLLCMNETLSSAKTIVIGDIHGRPIWKEIVKRNGDATHFVFLGDYLDPYPEPTEPESPFAANRLVDNLKDILDFKIANKNKVKLLIGNHDLHYMSNVEKSSRYSHEMQRLLSIELDLVKLVKNDILQLCWNIDNVWFVHAGFTNTWLRNNRLQLNADELNNHFKETLVVNPSKNPYGFVDKGYSTDGFGDDVYQGPLWVRPRAVKSDTPFDTYQVVGHTQSNFMNIELSDVTLCDSLAWNKYYVYTMNRSLSGVSESFKTEVIE
jgi:hypothetical protein